MSDGANHPQQPPRRTGSSPALPSGSSSTTNPRVMSAARSAPLPKEQQGAIGERLKSEGANVALNALSVVKEMVADFRQQDRFFKYKAFIVGGWLLLSFATLSTTCARGVKETGEFGAKLVYFPERSSVTIMNQSQDVWRDVTIIITDSQGAEWRASVEDVAPAQNLTVTPKQLLGKGGKTAPSNGMLVRRLEMRTAEGKALLQDNGVNLTEEAP